MLQVAGCINIPVISEHAGEAMAGPNPDDVLLFDSFRFDRQAGALFRIDESGRCRIVPLGSRARDLLALLVQRNGDTVTKEEIMAVVWSGRAVEEANLNVQVSKLRQILDQDRPHGSCIQTVTGYGYRFTADVTPVCRSTLVPIIKLTDDRIENTPDSVPNGESKFDGRRTTRMVQMRNEHHASGGPASIETDSFLIGKLGIVGKIDEDLAVVLLDLQQRLIDEYTDGTAAMLLIEQVVAAYQEFVRVSGWVASLSETIERELFESEPLQRHLADRHDTSATLTVGVGQHLVELYGRLVPLTEQCAGVIRTALAVLETFRITP
jgi:DNA-binding winged helix-turn-helix (wHTH) protein